MACRHSRIPTKLHLAGVKKPREGLSFLCVLCIHHHLEQWLLNILAPLYFTNHLFQGSLLQIYGTRGKKANANKPPVLHMVSIMSSLNMSSLPHTVPTIVQVYLSIKAASPQQISHLSHNYPTKEKRSTSKDSTQDKKKILNANIDISHLHFI